MVYQIKLQGKLDQSWVDWLGGVEISAEPGKDNTWVTTLTGDITDQPALFGVLDRIRDMNLVLISVNRLEMETRA